jgi:hypothetical protein
VVLQFMLVNAEPLTSSDDDSWSKPYEDFEAKKARLFGSRPQASRAPAASK